MKKIFEIKDKQLIEEILDNAEYGTLALCVDNKPYSVPINFVTYNNELYFHGAKKGKKIDMIKQNSYASFSVVEDLSLLPSYFSSDKGDACPATQLFQSVIIDGTIAFIDTYDEKAQALQALMEKLQKEGKYIPLDHAMYEKAINATSIYKLIPQEIKAKFKLGQHFNKERYNRVCTHLQARASKKDLKTLKLIKRYYPQSPL